MAKSNAIKSALYTLHNALVDFFTPGCTSVSVDALQSHVDICASLLEVSAPSVLLLAPAMVKETIKGKLATKEAPSTLRNVAKVVSIATLKKAILCPVSEMATEKKEIPVEKPRAPKEKAPETMEQKIKRIKYNAAKALARAEFDFTHKPDGANIETGAIEKFTFPALADWNESAA